MIVFPKLVRFVDESDLERTVSLLLEKDKSEVLFTCVNFLNIEKEDLALKERLIIVMYIDALQRHWIHVAMRIMF